MRFIFLRILGLVVIYFIGCKAEDKPSYLSANEMYAIYKIDGKTKQGIAMIHPDVAIDEIDCGIEVYKIYSCDGSIITFDSISLCCVWIPQIWGKCETIIGKEIEVYLTIPVDE